MEKFIVKITQINKNLNFRKSDETETKEKRLLLLNSIMQHAIFKTAELFLKIYFNTKWMFWLQVQQITHNCNFLQNQMK